MSPEMPAEDLEFDVLNEPWNQYHLSDGTRLRMKFVLVKIVSKGKDQAGNPILSVASQNVMSIVSPRELKGTPGEPRTYSPSELTRAVAEEDITFEIEKEDWSIYELKDTSTIHIKQVIAKISRTSLFDQNGDPIYIVNSQPIVKPILPRKK